jgi:hypothetical protein
VRPVRRARGSGAPRDPAPFLRSGSVSAIRIRIRDPHPHPRSASAIRIRIRIRIRDPRSASAIRIRIRITDRDPEHGTGTRNTEHGTRNRNTEPEHGTGTRNRNAEADCVRYTLSVTAAEIVAEVFRRILVPGVTGGELAIGKPFGRKAARAAAEAMGGIEISQEVVNLDREHGAKALEQGEEALLRRLRRLANADVSTIVPRIDGSVVLLAALLHDLIAAFHPELPGIFRRDAPHKLLEATASALAEVPAPTTLRAALLRHAWLGELPRFSLFRTEVRWWVGGASFVGRTPPSRLLAWPDVRRVRRDERGAEVLRLPELFSDRQDVSTLTEIHSRAMTAFLAASPLTDLALAGRLSPPFVWTDGAARLIANAAGARLARRAIALGEENGKYAREVIANVAGDAALALS